MKQNTDEYGPETCWTMTFLRYLEIIETGHVFRRHGPASNANLCPASARQRERVHEAQWMGWEEWEIIWNYVSSIFFISVHFSCLIPIPFYSGHWLHCGICLEVFAQCGDKFQHLRSAGANIICADNCRKKHWTSPRVPLLSVVFVSGLKLDLHCKELAQQVILTV